GRQKLHKKVDRGQESGAFDAEWAASMKEAVTFTTDYGLVEDADFIVEAATEDKALKGRIFADLERRCRPETIFASNSSHLEPERIFEGLENKGRTVVIHYFFPAERNPIVEVVPSADTAPELTRWLMDFYEAIGKVPIEAGSRYGYAIDPIFEGLFLAAALLAENGIATTKQIDSVATKALGLTVGPFTAMNLTGGNPITNVGLDNYTTLIHSWYRSPQSLRDAVAEGRAWEVPSRGETIEVPADVASQVTDALRGAYFGICSEIVDSGIATIDDLDMAVEIALDLKAPFRFMNQLGTDEALRLVKEYAANNPGFPVPKLLEEHGKSGTPFVIHNVMRRDDDGVAILTIRRPKALNALDQKVFDELRDTFRAVRDDADVKAVVLTGFGVKAFVSGADVRFLAKIENEAQGTATSRDSQDAIDCLQDIGKPTVCAYNGLAFGGGNELAMACDVRIARKDLAVLAGQPEVNLGILPGAGGTQRLPRIVGFENAAKMIRLGRPISAEKALEYGLVDELVDGSVGELRTRAIAIARELASGVRKAKGMPRDPVDTPASLPDLDLGHLSKAVDALVCAAMLEGGRESLARGLEIEAEKFGKVCATKDMRIGVDNFLKNGPRSKAEFVHE
ncbi:MAG: 3-hydroxyacyl-CoA dehydrogenase/enoyl-CoA hydratase family protein, partial [Planctomycetes bacterium]|nr:3-hydroxyacyl-CoA dehydrogenase/enoyl-CoA hydratase family protein [Planctomycetota bacterium]